MSAPVTSTLRFVRESYFTIFVAFSRLAQGNWSAGANMYKGAAGVFLFHLCLLLGFSFWAAFFTGARYPRIPQLPFYVVGLVVYALHCYVLIGLRYGTRFEDAFGRFERRRQIRLLLSAWLLIGAGLAFIVVSAFCLRPHFATYQ